MILLFQRIASMSCIKILVGSPENQVEIFRFVSTILSDALVRSFLPPPLADEMAYLDSQGHILDMGPAIRDAFDAIFGPGLILSSTPSRDDQRKLFREAYAHFVRGPFSVGMDRLTLRSRDEAYSFLFELIRPTGLSLYTTDIPYASVRFLGRQAADAATQTLDWPKLMRMYGLTTRETEVAIGILKGHINKEIAERLDMGEGTVKWYTHSLYEKTGFRSRTQLALGLTQAGAAN